MKRSAFLYLSAAIVFFPLDMAWLTYLARDFYKSRLGDFLLEQPRWWAAIGFYLIYLVGIVVFAMLPAAAQGSWRTALLYGALFGFVAYATYDLTNLATARGFSTAVALVDIVWGTVLTAVTAALGYWLAGLVADLT
jgi:uncharacterized membrane protein